ncbi:MAG: calcium/sodium antiporter [Bacteroidales bacterium]|jgi:cation:H+ antiporter|nr:calcium/sodium antiporter [Bacteroidales bacterium]
MEYLKLIGGLILLLAGGEFLVKGGASIASRLRISSLVIGMTVVAFGTSAPEFIVSLKAALIGSSEIAMGNVIGSNIANVAFILGLTAIIFPLTVTRNTLRIDWPIMMLASLLLLLAAIDGLISRFEGIIGFILLIVFICIQVLTAKNGENQEVESTKEYPIWLSVMFIIISCAGLATGADLLIDGATVIASDLGVSERIIGITIVAFGTSLPELVTSIIAAVRKQSDIAIGNIVGSNIFNVFCIIGLSATIQPIKFIKGSFDIDLLWMCGTALLLLLLMLKYNKKDFLQKGRLGRVGGGLLMVSYLAYIFVLLF